MSGPVRGREIPVRVVEHGEVRWLAWVAALSAGLLLLLITFHGWRPQHALGISRYWVFGTACALWPLATLLRWQRRPWVTTACVDRRALVLGDRAIARSMITGVRAAPGERGYSVAIAGGWSGGLFLEVEREEDARQLLRDLGVRWPGTEDGVRCLFRIRGRLLRWSQGISGVLGFLFGMAYAIGVGGLEAGSLKAVFGIPSLFFGIVASVLFVAQPLLRTSISVGEGSGTGAAHGLRAATEHLLVHWRNRAAPERVAPAPGARARVLDRGEETTRAWLARVDAVGVAGEGYRSDAPTAEELRQIAEDDAAPAQARLGALRVLARRHGEVSPGLQMRVSADLGPRVRVVMEADADEAAAELDAIGPAFRA